MQPTLLIDATSLRPDRMTGIERYVVGIVEHLPLALPEFRTVVALSDDVTTTLTESVEVVVVRRAPRVPRDQVLLAQVLRRGRADVAFFPGFFPPLALPRRTRVVAQIHDAAIWDHPDTLSLGTRLYYKPSLAINLRRRRIDAVVTSSRSAAADLQAHLPARLPIFGIPPGVEAHGSASIDPPTDSAAPEPFALAVGTIEPRKNYHTLLRAWELLAQRGERIPLKIVGRIGWGQPLTQLSAARGLVEVLGGVSDEELNRLYGACAVFVMPSRYEGFGVPVVEAMLRGRRCVVSDIPVFREIGEETLTYVDPASPEAWAEALASSWPRKENFDPGPEVAIAESFTWKRCAISVADVIRSCADKRVHGPLIDA